MQKIHLREGGVFGNTKVWNLWLSIFMERNTKGYSLDF